MSHSRKERIECLEKVFAAIDIGSEEWRSVVGKASYENPWFTPESCDLAMEHWKTSVNSDSLTFSLQYPEPSGTKKVGIIMAGNIPLVGLHDLLMTLISGHHAVCKLSSDDKALMNYIIGKLNEQNVFSEMINTTDRLPKDIDAVIATGSNNSFRYFDYYFNKIPNVIRKNRRSIAILNGKESEDDIKALANDSLIHFGLGCRNVSLIFLPKSMDMVKVIDGFEGFSEYRNHNKHHNNYTYHKALFLMNKEDHLDNGFLLFKNDLSLNAPLGTVFYYQYDNSSEIEKFIGEHSTDIQCVVGNYSDLVDVALGESQFPEIQDFADKVDTLKFLSSL